MTIEEIFTELLAHMRKGLMFHNQSATIYYFLNLCGYAKCHEYHYFEESVNCRCLHNFYLNNYGKIIPSQTVESLDLIPTNWYKRKKSDVDANTKRASIKDMMKKWIDWEEETKKLLENSYKQLYEQGEICAATKIQNMLLEVNEELLTAKNKYLDLETLGYDVSVIVPKQQYLYEKYLNKIKNIHEDDKYD